ncbi:MAG: DUF4423 domain-containing protein [Pseudomonadota bacterium]
MESKTSLMFMGADSPQDFITQMRENYRRKNYRVPLKIWSERLGYKSSRSLGMCLEGKRLPSSEMIELLAKDFGLTEKEKRVFSLLVLRQKEDEGSAFYQSIQHELDSIRHSDGQKKNKLSMDKFSKLFQWYVFVIRQLVATVNFKENLGWIRRRLRNKVSEEEIASAIDSLVMAGALKRDENGKLQKTEGSFVSQDGVPSNLIREHHLQMLERAKESVYQMGVYERDLSSWVFGTNRKNLAAIQQEIREFREKIEEKYSVDSGDSVFQLSIQCFEHTIDIGQQHDN